MSAFQRKFTPEAKSLIKKIPPVAKPYLRALTDKLQQNPYLGKPLQRELRGYYSIRHNHYRVVYSVNPSKKWVVIEYLGLRRDIYELFSRFLQNPR